MAIFWRADMQDSSPFLVTGDATASPVSLDEFTDFPPGAKGSGVFWGFTWNASGGWNNRAYTRWNQWDFDVSGVANTSGNQCGWFGGGSRYRPATGWPNPGPYYMRIRMRVVSPFVGTGGNDGLKFFGTHTGVFGGDHRAIGLIHSGSAFGSSHADADGIQFGIQRSVAHSSNETLDEAARVFVPSDGEFHHLQFSWEHGTPGVLKAWHNNNVFASPDNQDTTESAWLFDEAGYNEFWLGSNATNGVVVSQDLTFDIQDFEVSDTFDASWYPGGSGGSSSARLVFRRA